MRTFKEIYNTALEAGIIEEYQKYNELVNNAISNGLDTNSINHNFSEQQIKTLASLQYEITGIRPGGCYGCITDVIRNMNRWLAKNKPTETKKPKTNK